MGYLESCLPPCPDGVVRYLPCHVHGGAAEMAEDVAHLADVLDTLDGRRLIFTSTAALYDMPPLRTFYLLTKTAEEEMLRLSGADVVILRLGSIMGPAPTMRWDLLPQQMVWTAVHEHRIRLTMPTARRPILGIHDAVSAMRWAETAPPGTYDIASFNLGVRELAGRVAELTGAAIEFPGEPPHVPSFTANRAPASRLGWIPTDRLDDLIHGLIHRAREDKEAA